MKKGKRTEKLVEALQYYGQTHDFSKGNFIIMNVTEIALNVLLIDSQSLSIAEMTNKIMEKNPSLMPFIVNIVIPFPKN